MCCIDRLNPPVKPVTPAMLRAAVQRARQPAPLATPLPPASHRRLQGLQVLLVEDNPLNQQVAQELLEREGARVSVAENGEIAVRMVAQASPHWDAVLMDVQMPVMDGYTATRKIREELGRSELPIIAMTANAMKSDRQDAARAGMNAHVGKPFDLDQLVATLLAQTGHTQQDAPAASSPGAAAPPAGPARTEGPQVLDLAGATARLGGDMALLRRVLQTFARGLPAQLQTLQEQLQAGHWGDAQRQAHTLKGSAATVGAARLAVAAAEIEQGLAAADPAETPNVTQWAEPLRLAAQIALADIEQALRTLPAPAPNATVTPTMDRAGLATDLEHLLALLRNGDLASLDAFAELQKRHGPALADALDPLGEAMAGLELDEAIGLCEALRSQYTR